MLIYIDQLETEICTTLDQNINILTSILDRCKLVCKAWHRTIARHVEPAQAASLGANWRSAACSFYPVTPNVAGTSLTGSATPMDSSATAETSYRNVLCLKVRREFHWKNANHTAVLYFSLVFIT